MASGELTAPIKCSHSPRRELAVYQPLSNDCPTHRVLCDEWDFLIRAVHSHSPASCQLLQNPNYTHCAWTDAETRTNVEQYTLVEMLNTEPQRPLARIVAGLAGLAMLSFGIGALVRRDDMFSTNWFYGLVFAPLAILFGVFIIACALFKPSWLAATRGTIRRKRS